MTAMVRYAWWSILAIAPAVALGACGSVRYPTYYILDVAPTVPAASPSPTALGPIVVRELECPPYLCEGRLVYREGPHRVGFYDYHRWAVQPGAGVTRLLADRLRASSLFESVSLGGSGARASYLLRGEVERFEEVDEETSVHAICTISAEIVEAKTGSVIWSGTVSQTVPVQVREVAGVVAGLSAASQAVADRLVAAMANELPGRRSP